MGRRKVLQFLILGWTVPLIQRNLDSVPLSCKDKQLSQLTTDNRQQNPRMVGRKTLPSSGQIMSAHISKQWRWIVFKWWQNKIICDVFIMFILIKHDFSLFQSISPSFLHHEHTTYCSFPHTLQSVHLCKNKKISTLCSHNHDMNPKKRCKQNL